MRGGTEDCLRDFGFHDGHVHGKARPSGQITSEPRHGHQHRPWPSPAAKIWQGSGLTVVSGIEMLLWQAVAQIRLFHTGDAEQQLFNEAAVLHAMRDSVGLL